MAERPGGFPVSGLAGRGVAQPGYPGINHSCVAPECLADSRDLMVFYSLSIWYFKIPTNN